MAGKGKKRGKQRGPTPNQEAAAKKPRKARGKQSVQIDVMLTPVNKKGQTKANSKVTSYEAIGTRTANGKKRGKRKNNGKRGKRKNNGLRVHNSAVAALLKDNLGDFATALPAFGWGVAAWAIPGIIYAVIPKESRDQLAKNFGEGDIGHARARAGISGAMLLAVWLGSNKIDFLKKQNARVPAVMGSAVRFVFDLAGALLTKEGFQGNVRAFLGLPDGNYNIEMGSTTKGNWVSMTPHGVSGNFQQFTPSLAGWANMQLLPHGMTMQPPIHGMHSGIRSMHSQGGYGGIGGMSVQGGSF